MNRRYLSVTPGSALFDAYGKDADLQELLDDTSRLYNYFRNDDTPEMDYAAAIEPYWAKIRLPEEAEEESNADEDEPDEDEEPEDDSSAPDDTPSNDSFYTFCLVQFTDGGTSYAYLTGGISLKAGHACPCQLTLREVHKIMKVWTVLRWFWVPDRKRKIVHTLLRAKRKREKFLNFFSRISPACYLSIDSLLN